MADVKISALPLATTPLAGTEVLPIVQSATTDQVTVANLTAGRAVSASSLTLTTPLSAANGGTGITSLGTGVATTLGNAINGPSGFCVQNASGNLGVGSTGTTTVTNGIAVNNATVSNFPGYEIQTAGTTRFYMGANNADTYLVNTAAANMNFYINSAPAMTLDASKNLGIGTSSPGYKLDIFGGDMKITRSASNEAYIYFGSTTANYIYGGNQYNAMLFGINGAERGRFDSSGNWLVGTTSNTYSARQVVSGGFGVTIASTYALSDTPVKIAAGAGLFFLLRDTVNGGYALVSYENATTPYIVYQSSAGKYITTGTPTGTQILLATVTSTNLGVQASTAAGAGISVSVANIGCQN